MRQKNITLKKILATMALVWMFSMSGLVFANPTAPEPAVTEGKPKATKDNPTSKDGSITSDELFYRFEYQKAKTEGTKIGAVNALPNVSWQKTLTAVIKILLNITGGITLLALTVGGTMMIVSQSSPNLLEESKKIIYYSIAGLVIIAVSYALVIGISELEFFSGSGDGSTTSQEEGTTAGKPPSGSDTT